jgi:endonuclease/exonuclease/phosphatase family metal-dependent hydrolase
MRQGTVPSPEGAARSGESLLRRRLAELTLLAAASLRRRADDLAYKMRPDRPLIGLEYIQISDKARDTFFPIGQPLEIDVWNTFKGRREKYYDLLSEQTLGAHLVLLQEFRHDPVLEDSHRELFAGKDASMAINFFTQRNQAAPTGVCTIATVRAMRTIALTSKYLEPITRTPKTALCTIYPVGRADCPRDQSMIVLNSHSINFRLRRPFRHQMQQLEEQLVVHKGPIILVGDFNTWEKGRVQILEDVAHKIGLRRVIFPEGVKSVRGHQLDRVYIRGGEARTPRVFRNYEASDHSLLSFELVLH